MLRPAKRRQTMRKLTGILALLILAAASLASTNASAQCTVALCPGGSNIVTSPPYVGTPGPDCFIGTPAQDIMNGFGGDDFLCGGGGNDTIFGGEGNDFILGEEGNDNLFGDDDIDQIQGGPGDDTIEGGDGADFLFGEAGGDDISGGPGDDFIDGGDEDDELNGEGGVDQILGGDGNDTLIGGDPGDLTDGGDTLSGQDGNDEIFGGPGDDDITGGQGADLLRGEDGNDVISGGTESDQLFGGDGEDRLTGGSGDDTLNGDDGDDPQLDGGAGTDTINGGQGNDTANGGPDTDFINGGTENDTLSGGEGPDIINGGDGDDTINGNSENDTLNGDGGVNQIFGDEGLDVCLNAANMDFSCDLFTHASVSSFDAFHDGQSVVVRWETSSELGTRGFRIQREVGGTWVPTHEGILPGLLASPQGGAYLFRDEAAGDAETLRYQLIEVDFRGTESAHGPFEVVVSDALERPLSGGARYARSAHPRLRFAAPGPASFAPKQSVVAPEALYVGIEETGLYELTAEDLANRFALTTDDVVARIASGDFRMTEQGEPVAWTSGAGGESLLFYARSIDSLFTTERVYRLSLEEGTRMPFESAASGPIDPDGSFDGLVHLEEDVIANPQIATDPNQDYWYWQLVLNDEVAPLAADVRFDLEAVDGGGSLRVDLHGVSEDQHEVEVRLNDVALGTVAFEGVVPMQAEMQVAPGTLVDGENVLSIVSVVEDEDPDDEDPNESAVYLNFADLTYERRYETDAAELGFGALEDRSVEVTGLVDTDVTLDISDPSLPIVLTDAASTPTGLRLAVQEGREYFATASASARAPTSFREPLERALKDPTNRADYLIIAPNNELLDGAFALEDYRASNDGFDTAVVPLDSIYDEFAFGTPDPNAIHEFLEYATENWAAAPEMVVLIGKGSWDYRDIFGSGGNLLPPLMAVGNGGLLSSDTSFVDFEGDDGLPEIAIGRIPVTSGEQLQSVVDQIIAYEASFDDLREDMVMLADEATPREGDFGAWSDEAIATLPQSWAVAPVYRSDFEDIEATRALLFEELAKGPRVFGYLGHAGLDSLGKKTPRLLTTADVSSRALTGDGLQTVFADTTCLASRFASPGVISLGEAMLIDEQAAIAVWGSSGLSINEQSMPLLRALLTEIDRGGLVRIGPMINRALQTLDGSEHQAETARIYHLFGDPALRVAKQLDTPGTGGSAGSGGSGSPPGGAGSGGSGTDPSPNPPVGESDGGGCEVAPTSSSPLVAIVLVLLALGFVQRRRARRG